jgi:2-amino-4-hydroxy-6-hydroxymethyldihydropteridine diphosphokinase
VRGHLLLGSNLADPVRQLSRALEEMPRRGIEVLAASSFYETAPVGDVLDQPAFVNAAAAIRTTLEPHRLLAVLKEIEREAGRETDANASGYLKDGPRVLDLDIALLGDEVVAGDELTVPHPRLLERRFALIPLLELDFALSLPGGERLSDALAGLPLDGQDVVRCSAGAAASGP